MVLTAVQVILVQPELRAFDAEEGGISFTYWWSGQVSQKEEKEDLKEWTRIQDTSRGFLFSGRNRRLNSA